MSTAEKLLRLRIAQLDREPVDPQLKLLRVVRVLEQITSSGLDTETGTVSADIADAIIADCALLRDLQVISPAIVSGPLALDQQFWTATGKPEHLSMQHPAPRKSFFVTAERAQDTRPSTKPFGIGLFTATGVFATDMWRTYLHLNKGSTLHPLPWHTWRIRSTDVVRVREIDSASAWVAFNQSYPRLGKTGLIYPDWIRVSADYDAVHLTLRAILAIQGLRLISDSGMIAPSYWDVESTLWLHWRFHRAIYVRSETSAI